MVSAETFAVNVMTPEDYCDVFEQLQRADVPYVVVSGVAVVLRGHLGAVADLKYFRIGRRSAFAPV